MSPIANLTRIPLRNLFIVTVICKILASFLALRLGDPWILGFTVPLLFMLGYIVLGFKRQDTSVSDEQFGDSCYYLGFIFTISSIAFSLFDVPHLNEAGKLTEVAVRFGAAMISTLMGFVVRAYLVGFKQDSTAAMQSLEDQIMASANQLKTRLDLSHEAFRDYEEKVRQASSDTEAHVRLAVEKVGLHLSTEMATALRAIAVDVQRVHTTAADQMRQTAQKLVADLSQCSEVLAADINRAQGLFLGLADQLEARVRAVNLPHDQFTKELGPSVQGLVSTMTGLGADLTALKTSVQSSVKSIATALAEIDVAMKVPQSVRELIQKQEVLAKEVLGSLTAASLSIEKSASAVKDQTSTFAQFSTESAANQRAQLQAVTGAMDKLVATTASTSNAHSQIANELANVSKQLEALPGALRRGLLPPPAAPTPIRTGPPPITTTAQLQPGDSPIPPPPGNSAPIPPVPPAPFPPRKSAQRRSRPRSPDLSFKRFSGSMRNDQEVGR